MSIDEVNAPPWFRRGGAFTSSIDSRIILSLYQISLLFQGGYSGIIVRQ
jgi:hypothetical protein